MADTPQVNQDVAGGGAGSVIAANARKPRRVSDDAGIVEQHSISDQIKAENYDAAKVAVTKQSRGLRFNIFSPPGATGRPL